MALVLGALSLGVPLKGKGHPPVKQLNAKHEKYGLPPTDEWHSAIKTHNKLRLDKVDDYLGIVSKFRHQISNRVLPIGDKLGADVNGVLAFEECAASCDKSYDMVDKTDAQMMASYDEPNGRWSSCFQGCNLGVRNNTHGNNHDACTEMCEDNAPEAFFCKTACTTYATYLAARMPSKHKRAMQAAKKLRARREGVADASDASHAQQDWTEMAMEEELKTAKDEVTRLEGDLTNCKREFLKDSKTGEVKKQRLSKKDTPSWLSNWAAGMIYHNLLRVKTAAEYQHTRTEYKLLIRDRIQVEADKLNAPTWHILAFEKCATHCDVTYYPGFNKTAGGPPNDELMGGWDTDKWSSCVSGCNMGLRQNPNGTNLDACEGGCSGEGITATQAKDPYFCEKVGCVKYAEFVSDLKPRKNKMKMEKLRNARKRMRAKHGTAAASKKSEKWDYGFGDEWDQDEQGEQDEQAAESNWDSMGSFDDELRTTQDEIDRLQGELAACQTGLPGSPVA